MVGRAVAEGFEGLGLRYPVDGLSGFFAGSSKDGRRSTSK